MTPPSGEQLEIRHGDQSATVVEVGGGLREYTVSGTPILDAYGLDEMANAGRGQVLLPWPNRIRDGRYTFGGQELQLPINEVERNCAIHGLTRWSSWTVDELADDHVAMRLLLHPQPAYPFTLESRILYSLADDGLTVATSLANAGAQDLPVGAGFHPYLTVGTSLVDEALLTLPAREVMQADGAGIPTGEASPVTGTPYDFTTEKPIGALVLDTCFRSLDRDANGRAVVKLRAPSGAGVTLWAGTGFDYLMVFSGDTLEPARKRRSLAVEPMTCPPNAFQSGMSLYVLHPGEQLSCSWGISPA